MKISETYRREQERRHMDPDYGCASASYAGMVSQIINRLKVSELLDYGCGKARLFSGLKVEHALKLQAYDPGVPGFSGDPIPMQMVTCIDVLEHVEPECLEAVLDDLARVTGVIGFFTVCTESDEKPLKITEPMQWWLPKLMARFDLQTMQVMPGGFYVIVYAKPKPLIDTVTLQ